MRRWLALLVVTILTCGAANAADKFVGTWSSGSKELLTIEKEGEAFSAEFVRINVKFEYEKVQYSATLVDGALVISFELGDVSAKFDATNELLLLGGVKEFEKLPKKQAAAQLIRFEEELQTK